MSDSEFDEVGLSDLESVNGDGSDEGGAVVVELPQRFRQDIQEPKKAGHVDDESPSASHSSVPVRQIEKLTLQSSDSSWSHVGTSYQDIQSVSTWNASATASVAASSIISGFDLISLSGDPHRRCKRCTYLNGENDGICSGCGVALIANPCLDIDLQVAKNLQLKEEKQALKALELEEKKRKSLAQEPLLVQAQVLAKDIIEYVESHKSHGFETSSMTHLVCEASSFIDCFHNVNGTVYLAYHFSALGQIRRNGFGTNVQVSKNIEAALRRRGNKIDFRKIAAPTVRSVLGSIPEDRDADNDDLSGCLGWIVALIEDDSTSCSEETVPAGNGLGTETAVVMTLGNSNKCLPLVSFDASLRNNAIVQTLMYGLSQICVDFFYTDWSASEVDSMAVGLESPSKNPKSSMSDEEDPGSLEADAPNPEPARLPATSSIDSPMSDYDCENSFAPPLYDTPNEQDGENDEEHFFW